MKTPTTYQREIATAVTSDVLQQQGSVFTVEMPLGAGVNELASQLEMLVMSVNLNAGGALLRVVQGGQPDARQRLVSHLRAGSLKGLWSDESARAYGWDARRCGTRRRMTWSTCVGISSWSRSSTPTSSALRK